MFGFERRDVAVAEVHGEVESARGLDTKARKLEDLEGLVWHKRKSVRDDDGVHILKLAIELRRADLRRKLPAK